MQCAPTRMRLKCRCLCIRLHCKLRPVHGKLPIVRQPRLCKENTKVFVPVDVPLEHFGVEVSRDPLEVEVSVRHKCPKEVPLRRRAPDFPGQLHACMAVGHCIAILILRPGHPWYPPPPWESHHIPVPQKGVLLWRIRYCNVAG
jgi:hypothetical protein